MRYLSVCSGIEAASVAWKPLGWSCAGVSEIEKFPRAVLEHRLGAQAVSFEDHRHTPQSNVLPMFGDFTQIEDHHVGPIDLLVGGTPCQSFSIAGLRHGLDDQRGNLTLEFLRLAERTDPEWIVWENVPGILSDKTGALYALLDGLEELGYVVDLDILDAQNHGVPQRRRRVFICGQKAKSILKARTISSALTITQCLAECLALSLAVLKGQSEPDCKSWGFDASKPAHSLQRRMKLFGLDSETTAPMLVSSLDALHRWSDEGLSELASDLGNALSKNIGATKSGKSTNLAEDQGASQNTEQSLQTILGEALAVMNECITSTPEKAITELKIYTCARAMQSIAGLITQSMDCSPPFWSAASSTLTGLKEFINYARTASSDLFTDMEWIQPWSDFVGQAARSNNALGNLTVRSFGEVFPISACVSGHPAPRRKTGKVAPTIPARSLGGGGLGTDFDCDGGLIQTYDRQSSGEYGEAPVASTDSARDYKSASDLITHSLRGEGFDASEDGTGRGTPLVPVPYSIMPMNSGKDYKARETDVAQPIMAGGPVGGNQGGDGSIAGSLGAADGMHQQTFIAIQERAISENAAAGPDGKGWRDDGVAYTLEARTVPQAICFSAKDYGADAMHDCSPTLRAGGHSTSHQNGGVMPAVAYAFKAGQGAKAQGIGWQEECAPTLSAGESGTQRSPGLLQGSAVRRLTPTECERLQGFPEVQKCYTVLLCRNLSDQQKLTALAALQCHSAPSSVWNAERSGWMLSAKAADHHSSTNPVAPVPPVAVDVLIDLERQEVRLHSAGRSFSPVSNAGEKSAFLLPTGIDSFAHLVALLTRAWATATQDGKAASQVNTTSSTPPLNGKSIAISFGQGTAEPVVDVQAAIKMASLLSTSTTLPSGHDIENLHSTLTTLSSCVAHAIAGFIPETMREANCFAVRLTTSQGYTAIPWGKKEAADCPDGPRYKALGNSMAVPCMAWLGQRIAMVEALDLGEAA